MYRILTASADTYITNKIVNNDFKATDANVGQAGTLDLFKLYEESVSGSDSSPIELSRLLIKFDTKPLRDMHLSGTIDIADSTFRTYVKLHDVYGGQTTPSNFDLILFPLSQSFDEGNGYDVGRFTDIDSANWVTASESGGSSTLWNVTGASKSGSLGDENIDVILSGTITGKASAESLNIIQNFESGEEDLFMDVTTIMSATVKDLIPDCGFLIAFSGSYEKNTKSYFVKRFASRNVANTTLRPKLIVQFDDSIQDNHEDFTFGVSGSLYLHNYHFGDLANIISGTAGTEITGANCMILKLTTGSFRRSYNVSQVLVGSNRKTGLYSASLAVSQYESLLKSEANASGSITFDEIWSDSNETVAYLSSSVKIKMPNTNKIFFDQQRWVVKVLNIKDRYKLLGDSLVKFRVFAENADREVTFSKGPLEKKSEIFHKMYYRVRDFQDGSIIIPFDTENDSTRLSTDSSGMYFDFYMSSLPLGRSYIFDFLVKQNGFDTVITDAASKFVVE